MRNTDSFEEFPAKCPTSDDCSVMVKWGKDEQDGDMLYTHSAVLEYRKFPSREKQREQPERDRTVRKTNKAIVDILLRYISAPAF